MLAGSYIHLLLHFMIIHQDDQDILCDLNKFSFLNPEKMYFLLDFRENESNLGPKFGSKDYFVYNVTRLSWRYHTCIHEWSPNLLQSRFRFYPEFYPSPLRVNIFGRFRLSLYTWANQIHAQRCLWTFNLPFCHLKMPWNDHKMGSNDQIKRNKKNSEKIHFWRSKSWNKVP